MSEPDSPGPAFVRFFVAAELLGAALLSIVLLTAVLSPKVKKPAVWKNYIFSWIIFALSFSLLSFAGQQTGHEPSHDLCVVQSVLTYATPCLAAFTGLSFILNLLSQVIATSRNMQHGDPFFKALLIAVPYLFFAVDSIGAAIFASQNPVARNENSLFCHMTSPLYGTFTDATVALALLMDVAALCYIGYMLYRHHRTRHMLKTLYRIGAFMFMMMLALAISNARLVQTHLHGAFDSVIAILPLANFFLFGLHKDIIVAWCFWKPYNAEVDVMQLPVLKNDPETSQV